MNLDTTFRWARCSGIALALLLSTVATAGSSGTANAASAEPLTVCADPNYLPYSDRSGAGFENAIATIVGHALGRPVKYYWRSEREKDEYGEFLVATIESKNCDVLMNVPYGLQQVKTTRPYFISSYVFVYKKKRGYDLSSLDSPVLHHLKLGYEGDTPIQAGLKERSLLIGAKLFLTADDESTQPSAIVDAVEAGAVDVGMSWDPAVSYFVKQHPDLVAVRIDNSRTQGFPEQFSFPMAMATREADGALNAQLQAAVASHGPEIRAVLQRYNIAFTVPSGSAL